MPFKQKHLKSTNTVANGLTLYRLTLMSPQSQWRGSNNSRCMVRLNWTDWLVEAVGSLNRSLADWAKLLAYYALFYLILTGFVAGYAKLYLYFGVMRDYPAVSGMHSVLKLNPGLSVVPAGTYLSNLVHFHTGRVDPMRRYQDSLTAYLQWYEDYGDATARGKLEDCFIRGHKMEAMSKRVCRVDPNLGGPCNRHDGFGYEDGQPCFLLSINAIYGWLPDPVANETGVRISCHGVNDADKENLGQLCYYDDDSLPNNPNCKSDYGVIQNYYYPFWRQRQYNKPFIFVKLMHPKRNVIIMIQCYAIAKNIQVDLARAQGSVKFEVLID